MPFLMVSTLTSSPPSFTIRIYNWFCLLSLWILNANVNCFVSNHQYFQKFAHKKHHFSGGGGGARIVYHRIIERFIWCLEWECCSFSEDWWKFQIHQSSDCSLLVLNLPNFKVIIERFEACFHGWCLEWECWGCHLFSKDWWKFIQIHLILILWF